MTQIPGEPLGQLMERLDGTALSHSGIATRKDRRRDAPATHIASALAENLRLDIGGIRWDKFGKFWPTRDFYVLPMPDDLRTRALDYVDQFKPMRGKEGTFSFVKLVTVAAGLRSVELYESDPELSEQLYVAARDVATAWAATPTSHSWYCAELVANAVGRPFTRADFTPPVADDPLRAVIDEPEWAGWVVDRVRSRVEALEDPRDRSAGKLLALLSEKDWEFLVDAVAAIARSGGIALADVLDGLLSRVRTWMGGDDPDDDEEPRTPRWPLGEPRPMPGLPDPDAPLPYALVTPRMLWAAFGRDELRRLEQP